MSYFAKAGSFNIDSTKIATETQSITGVGFMPKAVLFWWSGSTATVDSVAGGDINHGFAMATSSTSRCVVAALSEDGQADSATVCVMTNNRLLQTWLEASTPTTDGILDFSSMDADGFTVVIDDQFSADFRISYLAIGGSDLTDVYLGYKQRDGDLGNCSVTGVGFQPDAVILLSNGGFVVTTGGNLPVVVGMATGSENQGVVAGCTSNNQSTSNTWGYGYSGECWCYLQPYGSITARDSFVSFDADGFTFNQLEGIGQSYYHFLCLKGGQYQVGNLTTRTDGNDIEEDVGFQPAAVLFASANRSLSTQDTATVHARMSIGAFSATDERCVQAVSDEDNLADTETAYTNQGDAVYAHVVDDAIEATMDIASINAGGFTCYMTDPETSACWVTYLAFGPSEGGTRHYGGVLRGILRGILRGVG